MCRRLDTHDAEKRMNKDNPVNNNIVTTIHKRPREEPAQERRLRRRLILWEPEPWWLPDEMWRTILHFLVVVVKDEFGESLNVMKNMAGLVVPCINMSLTRCTRNGMYASWPSTMRFKTGIGPSPLAKRI